jgi:alanine racemase
MSGRKISIIIDEQGANRVARELNKVNTIGDKVSAGFKRMTSGIKAFAKSALITTAVIAGLVYAASRLSRAILTPFMSLETTMSRVGIAAGATIEEIKTMTDVVNQLGRDTHFQCRDYRGVGSRNGR